MSTSRPEPGLASTEDTANAPMINPTWDSAPLSSWTTKTGKIAKSRNMLPENKKLLRQSNRKSRVKSEPEAGVAGSGGGCAGSGWAGSDTTAESTRAAVLKQDSIEELTHWIIGSLFHCFYFLMIQ